MSEKGRTFPFQTASGKVWNRRIFLVAAPSSEGLLTEPTAVAQPRRQEPLFMPLGRHLSADGPIGFKTRAFADFALFNHLISAGAAVAG
jgi:hypothetical protein